jgi:hypothetical protein
MASSTIPAAGEFGLPVYAHASGKRECVEGVSPQLQQLCAVCS